MVAKPWQSLSCLIDICPLKKNEKNGAVVPSTKELQQMHKSDIR
jgi:hypothetical protein